MATDVMHRQSQILKTFTRAFFLIFFLAVLIVQLSCVECLSTVVNKVDVSGATENWVWDWVLVCVVEQKLNVMAHAQKPDLVFQRNGRVHLYRRGFQFSRLLTAEVCASEVVMLDRPCPIQCTTAGYPLHSPFSPSLLHPCVSVCHHIRFLLYRYLVSNTTNISNDVY